MSSTKVKEIVDNLEEQVNDLSDLLEAGEISLEEFEELVTDLTDIDNINSTLELEEDKILAEKLISALLAIYNI